ncbi:MAG: FAD-dependent oxidoreductase [Bacilli bacterium]|nr:FAD-dependent oxidoreductase [Bacilli bacterium]
MNNVKELISNCESCVTKPCQVGCPLNIDIPGFIDKIKEEKYEEAFLLLSEYTPLMSLCGRICPHQEQCEGSCVKKISYSPVEIGKLEAFVGDYAINNNLKIDYPNNTKFNIAVVGGGPAGLSCAYFLRKNGYGVTIYEKHDYLGGLLAHGIPEFKLSRDIVKKVIDKILQLGIDVKYNQVLGKNILLDDLINNHDAVFIAIGSNESNIMNIPNENINGVYKGNELLENKLIIDYKDKDVVIIGGGNVAMNIASIAKKSGARNATIIYRRTEEDSPAAISEINSAKEDKATFLFERNVIKINGEDHVNSVDVVKTKSINKKDIPVNIEDSKETIKCDIVIIAIGSHPEKIVEKMDIEKTQSGKIKIDNDGHTSSEKIFAGGNVAGSKATVSWAAKSGRSAAKSIIDYLNEKKI